MKRTVSSSLGRLLVSLSAYLLLKLAGFSFESSLKQKLGTPVPNLAIWSWAVWVTLGWQWPTVDKICNYGCLFLFSITLLLHELWLAQRIFIDCGTQFWTHRITPVNPPPLPELTKILSTSMFHLENGPLTNLGDSFFREITVQVKSPLFTRLVVDMQLIWYL